MSEQRRRLIVVLGYSEDGRDPGRLDPSEPRTLHPICAQRLDHAASIATTDDVVVLSGWAREPGHRSEAELMAQAWSGQAGELVVDPDAETTVGNAVNVIDDLERTGAAEVVVVTSRWHRPRALTIFRWCLRDLDVTVVGASPPGRGRGRDRLGEVGRWLALPLQLAVGGDGSGAAVFGRAIDHQAVVKRAAFLAVGAVSLYLLAPTLLEVFSSWDSLRDLDLGWLVLIVGAQLAAFGCLWAVQRVALGGSPWDLVVLSQLAANAASRLVPGGAATGTAVHYRLLRTGGVPAATAATGLGVASLLQVALNLALPAVALPAIAFGAPVPDGLLRVAWAGGGLFVLLVALAAATLTDDRLLRWVGGGLTRVRSRPWRRAAGDHHGGEGRTAVPDDATRLLAKRNEVLAGLDGRWTRAVAFTAGRASLDYLTLVVAMAAIGADGRLSLVLVAYASATLLGLVPFTPGGLGFVEAGLTGTLVLAGIDAGDAVAIALLYRLASFWLPIPAGLVAAVVHRRRFR